MNRIDAKALQRNASIVEIVGRHVHLKKKGAEHVGLCPFHNDSDPSLHVNDAKGLYFCGPCGASGDLVNFLTRLGMTFEEAIAEITGEIKSYEANPEKRAARKPKPNSWYPVAPVPATAPNYPSGHYRLGEPSRRWEYRNEAGQLLGLVCRFETPEGKETLPLVYATDGARSEWRYMGFGKPRPLYGLDRLAARQEATVIVVEGEKTADAAQSLMPGAVVVSWIGGANGVGAADFTPLHGRRLLLWPDHDWQGTAAMLHVSELLASYCPKIGWILNPDDAPKGWDVADAEWTAEEATRWIRQNIRDVPAAETGKGPAHAAKWWNLGERIVYRVNTGDGFTWHNETPTEPTPEPDPDPRGEEYDQAWEDNGQVYDAEVEQTPAPYASAHLPFRALGYNKSETGQNLFHIYSYKAKQVLTFKSSSFTTQGLLQLADMNWFEHRFVSKRGGIALDAAAQFLMNICYERGVYDPDNIRGIGAWIDERRVVIHAGTHLVCEGAEWTLPEFDSRHIYEANRPFGFTVREPLSTTHANRLMGLLELMNWERPINAYLFAGWAIIAPVCGAMTWRPHIWLTGGKGTGKTTAVNILKTLIGKISIHVQGNTSEAGIRQQLQHDARPVLFDEADSDGKHDSDRLQTILALVRSSSSFEGGSIVKGGQSGTSKSYRIKACFAFASISPQVSNAADKSRVTVLSLIEPQDRAESLDRWQAMQGLMSEILSEEWCERLQARTIQMLPMILENAKVFTRAAASVLGEQRAGDQIGTLLAGAFSLFSSSVIDYERAVEWVQARDWSEIKSSERDEEMLLAHLLEQQTSVESAVGVKHDRTVGELVSISAKGPALSEVITQDLANQRLRRIGMKVEEGALVISNTSDWIKRNLERTPWAKGHNKLLLRLNGAKNVGSTKFASGLQTRAVKIPLEHILE